MNEHERDCFEEYVAVAALSKPSSEFLCCPVCGSAETIINHPEKLTFHHYQYCPAYILNEADYEPGK